MAESTLRKAPGGFTVAQWKEFCDKGFLAIPNAMTADEAARYPAARGARGRAPPPPPRNSSPATRTTTRNTPSAWPTCCPSTRPCGS
jgi:hypothetical protein